MIYGSLFSGIGAPECAWKDLGWEQAWCAEIDPFPCHVLAHRFGASRPEMMPDPDEIGIEGSERSARLNAIEAVKNLPETGRLRNLGDVTRVEWDAVRSIDLIVAGSPCQDFSVAGKRLGLDGPRGNMALRTIAIARRVRARWILFENVFGLLSNWSGAEDGDLEPGCERQAVENSDFAAFLGALRDGGYLGCWRVLDAQYAGVPQRRRRLFFVGYLGDWRYPAAVLFDRESLSRNSPPSREEGTRVAVNALKSSQGGSDDNDAQGHRLIAADIAPPPTTNHYGDHESREGLLVAGTLNANHKSAPGQNGQDANNGLLIAATLEATTGRSRGAGTPISMLAFGGNNTSGPIDVATAVNAHGGPHGRLDFESETFIAHTLRGEGFDASEDGAGRGTPLIPVCFDTTQITHPENRSNPQPGDPSHTLPQNGHPPAIAMHARQDSFSASQFPPPLDTDAFTVAALVGSSVRRLMPIECERLQGMPDDWTNVPYRGGQPADGPRYKAIGNSMARPLIEWIGSRLDRVETIIKKGTTHGTEGQSTPR